MAARTKKSTRVSKTRSPARKAKGPLARFEDGLPSNLKAYARRFRQGLARLERDLVKQEISARRKAARLLREASHQLGQIEARGERAFKRRATKARKDADRVLSKLEKAINPSSPRRKKKAAPKKKVVRKRVASAARS